MRIVWAVIAAAIVAGCASRSENISAAYVSPMQYEPYNCAQIAEESVRLVHRANEVAGVQDKKATNDAIATTVAIVIFWPAAFLVGGNDQKTGELARLRGELEALEQASIRKKCGITFQKPS